MVMHDEICKINVCEFSAYHFHQLVMTRLMRLIMI